MYLTLQEKSALLQFAQSCGLTLSQLIAQLALKLDTDSRHSLKSALGLDDAHYDVDKTMQTRRRSEFNREHVFFPIVPTVLILTEGDLRIFIPEAKLYGKEKDLFEVLFDAPMLPEFIQENLGSKALRFYADHKAYLQGKQSNDDRLLTSIKRWLRETDAEKRRWDGCHVQAGRKEPRAGV